MSIEKISNEQVKYQDSFKWYEHLYALDEKVKKASLRCMFYKNSQHIFCYYCYLKELQDHVHSYIKVKFEKLEKEIEEIFEKIRKKEVIKNSALGHQAEIKTMLIKLREPLRQYKRKLYQSMKDAKLLAVTQMKINAHHSIREMN